MLINDSQGQNGFAMIEALVTALIIAIGVSGVGVLLMRSIQGTQDNSQKSQAMWAVQDFAGRIRANSPGAKLGAYATSNFNTTCNTQPSSICASRDDSPASECDSLQMAEYDIWTTTCGLNSSIFDSPSDFIVNPTLTSECTLTDARNECVQYLIDLQWNTKLITENSDSNLRNNTNNYSIILEVN